MSKSHFSLFGFPLLSPLGESRPPAELRGVQHVAQASGIKRTERSDATSVSVEENVKRTLEAQLRIAKHKEIDRSPDLNTQVPVISIVLEQPYLFLVGDWGSRIGGSWFNFVSFLFQFGQDKCAKFDTF